MWILRIQCQEKHETLRNQHSNAEGQNSDCCTRTYPPSVRPGLPWLWCRHPIFQSSSPWLIFLELNADNGHDSCMMQMLQNPARNIRNQLLDPFNWDTSPTQSSFMPRPVPRSMAFLLTFLLQASLHRILSKSGHFHGPVLERFKQQSYSFCTF